MRKAKEQRHTQYFEMFGNRAIYHDGWIAACRHGRLPWQNIGTADFDKDKWELYNVDDDFSEANDMAATEAGRSCAICRICSGSKRPSTTCCRSTIALSSGQTPVCGRA